MALDEHLLPGAQREEDLLTLDDALAKLSQLDPRQAEIVELRFFGGLSVADVADLLETPKRTIERQWTAIRAWLRRELSDEGTS